MNRIYVNAWRIDGNACFDWWRNAASAAEAYEHDKQVTPALNNHAHFSLEVPDDASDEEINFLIDDIVDKEIDAFLVEHS